MQRNIDQIFIIFFFGTHLEGIFQFYDLDSSVFFLIAVHHIADDPSGCLLIHPDGFGYPGQFHGTAHGKKYRFDSCFCLLNLHSVFLIPYPFVTHLSFAYCVSVQTLPVFLFHFLTLSCYSSSANSVRFFQVSGSVCTSTEISSNSPSCST